MPPEDVVRQQVRVVESAPQQVLLHAAFGPPQLFRQAQIIRGELQVQERHSKLQATTSCVNIVINSYYLSYLCAAIVLSARRPSNR